MENLEQGLTGALNAVADCVHKDGDAEEERLRSAEGYLWRLSEPFYEDISSVDLQGRCIFADRFVVRVLGCRSDYLSAEEDTLSLRRHSHKEEALYPKDERPVARAFEEKGGAYKKAE
jgi:hypothetical protein